MSASLSLWITTSIFLLIYSALAIGCRAGIAITLLTLMMGIAWLTWIR